MSVNTSPPSAQVSMSDLMALPPQQLAAMANNQAPSIAPPWMITSALNAINQMKAGQQQPMQPGSIKDRVVAQTMAQQHPLAQGLGAIPAPVPGMQPNPQQMPPSQPAAPQTQPQQQMSDGGSVRHFAGGGNYGIQYEGDAVAPNSGNILPNTTGYEGASILDLLKAAGRGIGNAVSGVGDTLASWDNAMKTNVRGGTNPTASTTAWYLPTHAVGAGNVPYHDVNYGQTTPNPPAPTTGVPGTGVPDLLAKYRTASGGRNAPSLPIEQKFLGNPVGINTSPLQMPDRGSIAPLTPPDPTHIQESLDYYNDPNGPAAQAVTKAGLASYSAAMNPAQVHLGDLIGFGGRSATADAAQVGAQQARLDAYQAQKQQLGSNLDQIKAQQYATNVAHTDAMVSQQLALETQNRQMQNDAAFKQQNAALEERKLQIMLQANAIASQIRQDGLTESHMRNAVAAYEVGMKDITASADSLYGKIDPTMATTGIAQDNMQKKGAYIEGERQRLLGPLMDVFNASASPRLQNTGIAGLGKQGAPAGPQIAKVYGSP